MEPKLEFVNEIYPSKFTGMNSSDEIQLIIEADTLNKFGVMDVGGFNGLSPPSLPWQINSNSVPHFLRRSSKLKDSLILHIDIAKLIGNFCLGLCTPFTSFTLICSLRGRFLEEGFGVKSRNLTLDVELFCVGCM